MGQLRVAFSILDVDSSGYLDRDELKVALLSHSAAGGTSEWSSRHTSPTAKGRGGGGGGPGGEGKAEEGGEGGDGAAVADADAQADSTVEGDPIQTDVLSMSVGMLDMLPDGLTLDELIEDLDTSGDGRVSFEEFSNYLLTHSLGTAKA